MEIVLECGVGVIVLPVAALGSQVEGLLIRVEQADEIHIADEQCNTRTFIWCVPRETVFSIVFVYLKYQQDIFGDVSFAFQNILQITQVGSGQDSFSYVFDDVPRFEFGKCVDVFDFSNPLVIVYKVQKVLQQLQKVLYVVVMFVQTIDNFELVLQICGQAWPGMGSRRNFRA